MCIFFFRIKKNIVFKAIKIVYNCVYNKIVIVLTYNDVLLYYKNTTIGWVS